jgi:hypothetical protein
LYAVETKRFALAVDDEPTDLENVRCVLANAGYHVSNHRKKEAPMRVRELALVFTVIAATLAIETSAKADVIWTFENADAGATNVQGSITIANVSSAAPGTKWDLSDITDFAFFYEGFEIASSANAGQTTFFGTNSGISILEFTASEPFLPFVSIPLSVVKSSCGIQISILRSVAAGAPWSCYGMLQRLIRAPFDQRIPVGHPRLFPQSHGYLA